MKLCHQHQKGFSCIFFLRQQICTFWIKNRLYKIPFLGRILHYSYLNLYSLICLFFFNGNCGFGSFYNQSLLQLLLTLNFSWIRNAKLVVAQKLPPPNTPRKKKQTNKQTKGKKIKNEMINVFALKNELHRKM